MNNEYPDVNYGYNRRPDGSSQITATFDTQLASYLQKIVAARFIEEIVSQTVHRWLEDNYLEVAGKISIDAVVNAAIGKIVIEALRDRLKEETK